MEPIPILALGHPETPLLDQSIAAVVTALIGAVTSAATGQPIGGGSSPTDLSLDFTAAMLSTSLGRQTDAVQIQDPPPPDPDASHAPDSPNAPDPIDAETIPAGRNARLLDESGWTIDLGITLWIPTWVEGTATVFGLSVPFDMHIGDVYDNFKPITVTGRVEAWYDNTWGLIFNGTFVQLRSNDFALPTPMGGIASLNYKQALFDLGGGWRAVNQPFGESDFPRVVFDVLGGLRIQYLEAEATIDPVGVLPKVSSKGSKWWAEPFIGGRVMIPLSPELMFTVRGDVSGFGLGGASDLTWNLGVGLGWSVSPNLTLEFAYRVLDIDYQSGSGASAFGLDVRQHGPWFGFVFTF